MISVLIADDEAPARDELSFLLRQDSRVGEIHQAASGAEAIQLLSRTAVAQMLGDVLEEEHAVHVRIGVRVEDCLPHLQGDDRAGVIRLFIAEHLQVRLGSSRPLHEHS